MVHTVERPGGRHTTPTPEPTRAAVACMDHMAVLALAELTTLIPALALQRGKAPVLMPNGAVQSLAIEIEPCKRVTFQRQRELSQVQDRVRAPLLSEVVVLMEAAGLQGP